MANKHYEPELKEKVLRLYLEEGRTKKSLTEEYNLGQGTLTYWLRQYRKECENNPVKKEEANSYSVNKKILKELEELRKESEFLKKPNYVKGTANEISPNLLNREFNVKESNKMWCSNFTYFVRPDGSKRYNCTIIDLCGREAIASLNGNHSCYRMILQHTQA